MGDDTKTDEFFETFQKGGGVIFIPNIAKGTTDPGVDCFDQ